RMWSALLPTLSASYRVLAPDLPGYGEATMAPGPFSNVAEVVGFLDDLNVPSAAFVGASFGGRVALEVATAHPDRVERLVLLCPGLRGLEPTAAAEAFDAEEWRLIESGDLDGAVALNVDTWLGPDADEEARHLLTRMQRQAFEVQLAADEWPDPPTMIHDTVELGSIRVPTTVVLGAKDVDWLQTAARRVAADVPGADLVELDWAGHLPALERPAETAELVLAALNDR
ncbi:MAG TPA: alpha/beta fold hydrolase, partial [Lapillicoccus sp.]|nr:alpha/beta fold hydrolase [Lapillicoccus sp.]